MVGGIVGVVTAITFRAPIAFVDETFYGGAPLVMIIGLENDNLVFCVWTAEYQKKRVLSAQHFQLVWRVQGGQVLLKFAQFWESTRTFGDARRLVELPSIDALAWKSVTESVPVTAGHVMTVISMTVRPHGDNGPGAAQFIFVDDLDDGILPFTVLLHGSLTHIPLFSPAARGRHSHQHNIDLQSPVGVELFIGI